MKEKGKSWYWQVALSSYQPEAKSGVDSFGGLGATLVDSLDTLYIMGLDDQFQRAREWVTFNNQCLF